MDINPVIFPLFVFHVLKPNNIQLDEKQEPDGEPPQQATTKIFKGEEQLNIKCNQKNHSPKREEQPDSEPTSNIIVQNDIQWGRKTLQKLLANLGLL